MNIFSIISFIIVLISLVMHEMAHAYTAVAMGDDTPRYNGRLSANPFRHLDMTGSVLLPGILMLVNSPVIFGWAKPVMFNPNNFITPFARRYGALVTAMAGPISNITIAVIMGMILRFYASSLSVGTVTIVSLIVLINLTLALFNLLPIPPLDGHYIIEHIFPHKFNLSVLIGRFGIIGMILPLVFALIIWQLIEPVIPFLFSVITGINI